MGGTGGEIAVIEDDEGVPIVGWVSLSRGDLSQFCSLDDNGVSAIPNASVFLLSGELEHRKSDGDIKRG